MVFIALRAEGISAQAILETMGFVSCALIGARKKKVRSMMMKGELTRDDIAKVFAAHEKRLNLHWRVITLALLANPIIALLLAAAVMWLCGMEADYE